MHGRHLYRYTDVHCLNTLSVAMRNTSCIGNQHAVVCCDTCHSLLSWSSHTRTHARTHACTHTYTGSPHMHCITTLGDLHIVCVVSKCRCVYINGGCGACVDRMALTLYSHYAVQGTGCGHPREEVALPMLKAF